MKTGQLLLILQSKESNYRLNISYYKTFQLEHLNSLKAN